MENKHFERFTVLIGTLLGIALLIYVFRGINFGQIREGLYDGNWWYLLPLVGSIPLFYWVKAKRWRYLLDPVVKMQTGELLPTTIVGAAVNFVLFGYVGEFVKCYLLGEQVQRSKSAIFATIILERVFDLLTVLLFLGAALTLGPAQELDVKKIGIIATGIAIIIVFILVLCVKRKQLALSAFKSVTRILPEELRNKILDELELGIEGLVSIANPRLLTGVISTSIIQWAVMASTSYFSFLAVNAEAPFTAAIFVMSLIIMGMLLPNSPGHIGMIEFCFVIGLKPYGVPTVKALSAAMIYHITLYGIVICAGGMMLRHWHLTFAGVRKKGEEYSEDLEKNKENR